MGGELKKYEVKLLKCASVEEYCAELEKALNEGFEIHPNISYCYRDYGSGRCEIILIQTNKEEKNRKQEIKWLTLREAMQALLDWKKIARDNADEGIFRCLNLNGELVDEDGELCDLDTYLYDEIGDRKYPRKFRIIE